MSRILAMPTTLKVKADDRPMMRNCDRFSIAAAKPEAIKARRVLVSTWPVVRLAMIFGGLSVTGTLTD